MSLESRIILRSNSRRRRPSLVGVETCGPDEGNAVEEGDTLVDMQSLIALGVQAVKKLPEGRPALVEELRARVKAGTYQSDSAAIAMKLLGIDA
jgi:Anti-sigma-28 factor, FlgM